MAAVLKGATTPAFIWGIDTGVMTNAVLTSINFDSSFNNSGSVQDELGNIVHERHDDIHVTGSATMTVSGDTTLDLVDSVDEFTYDSVTYYITDMSVSRSNNSFHEISVTFENIDYAANELAR